MATSGLTTATVSDPAMCSPLAQRSHQTPSDITETKETTVSPDTTTAPAFLNRKQVLARYGITSAALKKWLRTGRFPLPIKIGEGDGDPNNLRARWALQDLLDYEDRCRKRTLEKREVRKAGHKLAA